MIFEDIKLFFCELYMELFGKKTCTPDSNLE